MSCVWEGVVGGIVVAVVAIVWLIVLLVVLVVLIASVSRVARVEEGSPDRLPTGGPQEAAQAQQDLQGDLPVGGLRSYRGKLTRSPVIFSPVMLNGV